MDVRFFFGGKMDINTERFLVEAATVIAMGKRLLLKSSKTVRMFTCNGCQTETLVSSRQFERLNGKCPRCQFAERVEIEGFMPVGQALKIYDEVVQREPL